jgi:predicted small secreted protein
MVKKIAALTTVFGLVARLAACNTISGMGKDLEASGSAIDKAATIDSKKK